MPLDPLAEAGFAAPSVYERGRPGYPAVAAERLISELGLTRASRVLDVAAGTGKLTRLLVPRVGSVVAVEPSDPMRRMLARTVPEAEALAGTAERLPLPDASVDAAFAGEAFHWFDGDAALSELARVLRPGGGLALLWNVADTVEPPWPGAVSELTERRKAEVVPAERRYDSGLWRRPFERTDRFEPLASARAEHVQRLDPDGLAALVGSWSYVAALPDGERAAALDRVRAAAPPTMTITFRTDLYWTRATVSRSERARAPRRAPHRGTGDRHRP